jgi:hypothetical protein
VVAPVAAIFSVPHHTKKNCVGKKLVRNSIAKADRFRVKLCFFLVTKIASGWCKELKPLSGFNLTVM